MTPLTLIAGNTPTLQRLLEAGGIMSVEDLAHQEPRALARHLAAAVGAGAPVTALTAEDTGRLIGLARKLLESRAGDSRGPAAAGWPDLNDVPEAIVIQAAAPKPEGPGAPKPAVIPMRPSSVPGPAPARPATPVRPRPVEPASSMKFRGFDEYEAGEMGVSPLPRKSSEDTEEVIESLKRFNHQPGEPVPRLVRRGVPHPRPYFLVFCSLIAIAWRLLTLSVIVGTPIALWPAFTRGDIAPLLTFLWVIGTWLVCGLFFLVFALRARCRVCTNQIFWSKRCFKNQKAHRVPGLGLVASLALHALLFGWFRCMYCGTAIRLKFVADPERPK